MENKDIDSDTLNTVVKNLDQFIWNIVNNVVCPICQELFSEPVTTLCGHNFCQKCLNRLLYSIPKISTGCPLCRYPLKRRTSKNNYVLLEIAKMCHEFPKAFKEDVIGLNPSLRDVAEELVKNSRTCEISSQKENEASKTNVNKNVKEKPHVNESGKKIVQKLNRSRESVSAKSKRDMTSDLQSISQLQSTSKLVCDSSDVDDKLKNIEKMPTKQRVNDWLQNVDSDITKLTPNDSCDSIVGTPQKPRHTYSRVKVNNDASVKKRDEKPKPADDQVTESVKSFVRVNYDKSNKAEDMVSSEAVGDGELLTKEADPYEFIASQKSTVGKVKRRASNGRRKKIPAFEAVQSFRKGSKRKSPSTRTKDSEHADYGNETNTTGVDDSRDSFGKMETLDVNASRNTGNKSRRQIRRLCSDSDDSVRSWLNNRKKAKLDRDFRKAEVNVSKDDSDFHISDCKSDDTKNNDPEPETDLNVDTNRNTEEMKNDSNDKRVHSPGWSRVSNLKADFGVSGKQRKRKDSRKSLNISGGEIGPTRSRKKRISDLSLEDEKEMIYSNSNNNNINLYIEDLSQSSNLLLGFDGEKNAGSENAFKQMVENMERELEEIERSPSPSTDIGVNDQIEDSNANECEFSNGHEIGECAKTDSDENNKDNESESLTMDKSHEKKENRANVSTLSVLNGATGEETTESISSKVFTGTATNCKMGPQCRNITFSLLGKIGKKKRSSISFLQLGRLSTGLARSRSTVVKLIFPKSLNRGGSGKKSSKSTVTTSGVQTNLSFGDMDGKWSTNAQTAENEGKREIRQNVNPESGNQTVDVAVVQAVPEKIDAATQTSQSFLRQTTRDVQTSQRMPGIDTSIQTVENDPLISGVQKDFLSPPSQLFDTGVLSNVSVSYSSEISNSHLTIDRKEIVHEQEINADAENIVSKLTGADELPQRESVEVNIEDNASPKIDSAIDLDTELQREMDKTWLGNPTEEMVEDDIVCISISNCESKVTQSSSDENLERNEVASDSEDEKSERNVEQKEIDSVAAADEEDEDKLMQRAIQNVNLDLKRIRSSRISPVKSVRGKQPPPYGECTEESDSDLFIEQTPPKNSSITVCDVEGVPQNETEANGASRAANGSLPNANNFSTNSEESFLLLSECPNEIETQEKDAKPRNDKAQPTTAGACGTKSTAAEKIDSVRGRDENDENNLNRLNSGRKPDENRRKTAAIEVAPPKVSPSTTRRICIVSSGVQNRKNIERFVSKFKVDYSTTPRKDMTHLVVGLHETDEFESVPFCTPKMLYAIANKKWIVSESWVEKCLSVNAIVSEEPFESVDPVGGNGCRTARLSPGNLLEKMEVYLLGGCDRISKEEFSGLISDCGATVVRQPDGFSFSPNKIRMILAEGCNLGGNPKIQYLMRKYRTAIMSWDVVIVSIQSYRIVNFTPYMLCTVSTEELTKWGYPYHLVRNESGKESEDASESDDGDDDLTR